MNNYAAAERSVAEHCPAQSNLVAVSDAVARQEGATGGVATTRLRPAMGEQRFNNFQSFGGGFSHSAGGTTHFGGGGGHAGGGGHR